MNGLYKHSSGALVRYKQMSVPVTPEPLEPRPACSVLLAHPPPPRLKTQPCLAVRAALAPTLHRLSSLLYLCDLHLDAVTLFKHYTVTMSPPALMPTPSSFLAPSVEVPEHHGYKPITVSWYPDSVPLPTHTT